MYYTCVKDSNLFMLPTPCRNIKMYDCIVIVDNILQVFALPEIFIIANRPSI